MTIVFPTFIGFKIARRATEHLLRGVMISEMFTQTSFYGIAGAAKSATILSVACVRAHVATKVLKAAQGFATLGARVNLFSPFLVAKAQVVS